MFKGIIPGKRASSNDLAFDMIEPRPAHGKENRPQAGVAAFPNVSKGGIFDSDTRKLAEPGVLESQRMAQSPAMEIAFDKLLVCALK